MFVGDMGLYGRFYDVPQGGFLRWRRFAFAERDHHPPCLTRRHYARIDHHSALQETLNEHVRTRQRNMDAIIEEADHIGGAVIIHVGQVARVEILA